jgi:hypothetical protein
VEIKERARVVFQLAVNYAVKMLKWSDNENLPQELMPHSAPDTQPRFVTMLFNDETHTYEEVGAFVLKVIKSSLKPWQCLCLILVVL